MPKDLPAIPFGTQYYRAPVPRREDWDHDLGVIAATGMDSIKIWLQWRWNHPEPDRVWLDDMIGLCDAAEKHGLMVIPNAILDVAPTWLYEKYPDAHMISAVGHIYRPRVTSCRQIGGAPGPCYHHDGAWRIAWDFLAESARRLAEHPAVWGWDLWNEPELNMVQRFVHDGGLDQLGCYCDHSRAAFVPWVMNKYGSLDAVNAAWGRNYKQPEQIEPARALETYRDAIDWRLFFRDTLAANMARRAEIIRDNAPGQRIISHTVPPPALNVVNASSDEWKLAEPAEEFGASFPQYAPLDFEIDVNRSAAKGKRLWSAECYPGVSGNPALTDSYRARLHGLIFAPLLAGYKGYLIWQWQTERLGIEGGWSAHPGQAQPDWPAVDELKRIIALLRDHGDWLAQAPPAPPRTAILFDPEAELFGWCASGKDNLYHDALIGCHQALAQANLPLHFVHADEAIAGGLDGYDVLLAPYSTWASQDLAGAMGNFVEAGGMLIAEADFARRDPDTGLGWADVPGCGMHEVFGARQLRHSPRGGFPVKHPQGPIQMMLREPLGTLEAGAAVTGFGVEECYAPADDGKTLAVASEGLPAIVESSFGKGRTALIGTFISAGCRRGVSPEAPAVLGGLIERLAPDVWADRPIVTGGEGVRVAVMGDAQRQWIMISNPGRSAEITLSLPDNGPAGRFERLLGEGGFELAADADTGRRVATIELEPQSVTLFDSDQET